MVLVKDHTKPRRCSLPPRATEGPVLAGLCLGCSRPRCSKSWWLPLWDRQTASSVPLALLWPDLLPRALYTPKWICGRQGDGGMQAMPTTLALLAVSQWLRGAAQEMVRWELSLLVLTQDCCHGLLRMEQLPLLAPRWTMWRRTQDVLRRIVNTSCPQFVAVGIAEWHEPPRPPFGHSGQWQPPFPGSLLYKVCAGSVTAGAVPGAGRAALVRRRSQQCHRSLGRFPGRRERRCQCAYSQGGCWQREESLPLVFGRGKQRL